MSNYAQALRQMMPDVVREARPPRTLKPRGPTILDQLTAPTVTPDVLRVRAEYWRGVADRHDRHGRNDQAARLRANCDAMERQAIEMQTMPVVSITAPT